MKEEIIIQIVLNDNTEIDLTLILAVIQLHIISSINIKPNHDIFLIDQELVIEITINWPMNYSLRLIQHILMQLNKPVSVFETKISKDLYYRNHVQSHEHQIFLFD